MLEVLLEVTLWYCGLLISPCLLSQVPSASDVNEVILSSWNSGVQTAFTFAAHLPEHTTEAGDQALTFVSDLVKNDPSKGEK